MKHIKVRIPNLSVSYCIGILLALSAVLLNSGPGEAASYCDRVRGGDLSDSNLLFCEDFEAPTLTSIEGLGQGSPHYGPWHDEMGPAGGCARGQNSYWTQKYGGFWGGWKRGQPSSPKVGCSCSYDQCFSGVWHPTDLYQANSFAQMSVLQNGQFNAEVSAIGPGPTGTASGGSGVFAGNASLGWRIRAGVGHAGPTGNAVFPRGGIRTWGITMALAYPTNLTTSGILNAPWKHNEWGPRRFPSALSPLFVFHNVASHTERFPFFRQAIQSSTGNASECNSANSAATVTVGEQDCTGDGSWQYWPALYTGTDAKRPASANNYKQTVDFPPGSWGCVRGHFENIGLTNSRVRIWFTGAAKVERLLVDITRSTTGTVGVDGYDYMAWNAYPNTNQGAGEPPTTQTTFRYEDNVHVRAGAPVSCAQIGFGSASSTASTTASTPPAASAPAAPTGLTIK